MKILKIKCPQCGSICEGKIEQDKGMPYFSYSGYCGRCKYHIGESEFEEV